jgi:hypothetical protein
MPLATKERRMLEFVYLFLAYLRRFKELTAEQINSAVEKVKNAWLQAFIDTTEILVFGGEYLSDRVPLLEIGVFSARERLRSLVQKIGAMRHEVEQLLELDAMAPRVKSKFGEAMRTRDATSLIKSVGWQKWLQYALMYRRVSVVSTLRALAAYDGNGLCFPCSGTGVKTCRVKRKEPKVIKRRLADEVVRNPYMGKRQPEMIRRMRFETVIETHRTTRRTCVHCKGTGRRKSANEPVQMPFDLVDIIELIGIMKALDEHTGTGGTTHKPAGLDDSKRNSGFKCVYCGHIYPEAGRCTQVVPWWAMPHDPLEQSWLPLRTICNGRVLQFSDTTAEDASDFHDTMHHNSLMDFFDRENEPGGDANTNPNDRSFSMEREFEETDGEFNIQLLKRWKAKWLYPGWLPFMRKHPDGKWAVTVDLHDPMTKPDLTQAGQFPRLSGEHAHKSWDSEISLKFGTKAPSVFNKGRKFRGQLELENVRPAYTSEGGWFDNYGRGGPLQELIADRIYSGHFAWDPEFYKFRDVTNRKDYYTGQWKVQKWPMRWASVYVLLDDEIREAFTGLPKDAWAINLGISGDMVAHLRMASPCPQPTHTLWFDTGDINMPVANYDGQWHICNHVLNINYRLRLRKQLEQMKIELDSMGQPYARGLPQFHRFEAARKNSFTNGKIFVRKGKKVGEKYNRGE